MEYALLYSAGTDPQPYDPADDNIGEWVDDLITRRISEYGERLRPGQDATTVRVRDGRVLVTEGPYTEAREWIGGFDIIDCADLDEAIEIASRHPAARSGTAEVRPFMVWPDATPGARVVPDGFPERPTKGRRYLMLVCVDPSGPEGEPDDDVQPWVDEMDARGVRLFGEVLRPPEDAVLVRSRGGRTLVTDAPLSEGKEWIAGFDFLEVADLQEAVSVAAAHPMASTGVIVLSPAWPFDPYGDQVARAQQDASDQDVRTEPPAGAVA